jgi:hypothetical protein
MGMERAGVLPCDRVRHPGEPDWGLGQVQSVAGMRVTVNFEHAGKRLINAALVELVPAPLPRQQGKRPPA